MKDGIDLLIAQHYVCSGKDDREVTWMSKVTECDVYGKYGSFGKCNGRVKLICTCFRGFEPESRAEWDAGNWSSGCVRKAPLFCDKNNTGEDTWQKDGVLKVKGLKLPDRLMWFPTMESECGNQCLNKCSCVAYAYDAGIRCMLWNQSLIDVLQLPDGTSNLYIRLACSELGTGSCLIFVGFHKLSIHLPVLCNMFNRENMHLSVVSWSIILKF